MLASCQRPACYYATLSTIMRSQRGFVLVRAIEEKEGQRSRATASSTSSEFNALQASPAHRIRRDFKRGDSHDYAPRRTRSAILSVSQRQGAAWSGRPFETSEPWSSTPQLKLPAPGSHNITTNSSFSSQLLLGRAVLQGCALVFAQSSAVADSPPPPSDLRSAQLCSH